MQANFLQRCPQRYAWAACATVLLLRSPALYGQFDFWAEDGSIFLKDSLQYGWRSLGMPAQGGFHGAARLLAYISHFLPPVAWAPAYLLSAWIVGAWVLSFFAREGFGWILPSAPARLVVCLMFCLGPGTPEVTLNLCTLHFLFSWLLFLLLLERPRHPRVGLALLVFSLAASSTPLVFLFALLRWAMTGEKEWAKYALCLVPGVSISFLFGTAEAPPLHLQTLVNPALAFFENLTLRALIVPVGNLPVARWLGDKGLGAVGAALVIVLGGLAWLLRRAGKTASVPDLVELAAVCVCAALTYPLLYLAREGMRSLVLQWNVLMLWVIRYSFLTGASAVLLWSYLLFHLRPSRRWESLVWGGALAAFVLQPLYHLKDFWVRRDTAWPEQARRVESWLSDPAARTEGKTCAIDILPEGKVELSLPHRD